ncbi:MAG: NADPH:quinone oxidoreductase [Lautropia sp. SCN 70-15]|nr:MAG: NADPH:quinone oxidoreductase [Lautropia sp. SCN 70-15]
MKAVVIREFGPPDSHRVEEVPDPVLADHEVLIDVKAAAVNFPDLLVVTGKYQILPERPFSPGKDAAGIVAAVGSGVRHLSAGDRVVAQVEFGAYASRLAASEAQCHQIPDDMSFVDAAAMGLVYQTAYFALVDRGQYRRGESVLVNGAAGGVGLAAVQIAKALGATVLAGVASAEQADLARRNGADHVVDLSVANLRDAIRDQVHAAVGKRGVDVVLDTLGGDVFDGAIRALAWCGRIVVIGFAAGRIPDIKANYLLVKNISAIGLQWSDYRSFTPERVHEVQRELTKLYQQGAVRPNVMRTYPVERFAEAMSVVHAGRALGKIVLTFD